MKKYKLRVKDNINFNGYQVVSHSWSLLSSMNGCWLQQDPLDSKLTYSSEYLATEFSEERINRLPYGFIAQHDLIEVEEDLFNIVCPYSGNILLEDRIDCNCYWSKTGVNEKNPDLFKKEFTQTEIELNYQAYNDEAFMKKVN